MANCLTCKAFAVNLEYHKCPPQWEVVFGNTVEEGIDYGVTVIYARDEEDAAEKAADEYDCVAGEYCILQAGEATAWARMLGSTAWTKLVIYGESVPQYTAYIQ